MTILKQRPKQFYSCCYDAADDQSMFLCSLSGLREGASEKQLSAELEEIGGTICMEDTYEFEQPYREVHDKLIELGYQYMGPVDDGAINTSC